MNLSIFQRESEALADEIIAQRRDFHRHPELGFQEHRTAGIVADAMNDLGLKICTGVAETGVIALLKGERPGPTILLRFDMDALPIQEETGASYASTFDGVMHACGHDGHTAIGMAVAKLLHSHRQDLPGTVKLVFQPAEEGLNGAERMVEEGVLLDPTPDYTLAMHLWNDKPVGWIGVTPGTAMAGSERLEIEIAGRGGHGAAPHQTADPVLATAQVICALQSVVSRNLDPGKPAVVSVTKIQAGDAFNVIPSRALLGGTIRTFDGEVRDLVLQRVKEIVCGIAEAMGCEAKVKIKRLTPPVINNQALAIRIQSLIKRVFPEAIVDSEEVVMGSEDMAFMMEDVPGCYMFVGSGNPAKGLDAPHHNPHYDFDEVVLPKASALMAAAAWMLLEGE
ncbi:MAG: amidohydrolase [Anaerolineales bacterium]